MNDMGNGEEFDDLEYLREEALIVLEKHNQMINEWQEEEMERLPAKIEVVIEVNKEQYEIADKSTSI